MRDGTPREQGTEVTRQSWDRRDPSGDATGLPGTSRFDVARSRGLQRTMAASRCQAQCDMVPSVMGSSISTGQGIEDRRTSVSWCRSSPVSVGSWDRSGWVSTRLGTEGPWWRGNDSARNQGSSDNMWWPRGFGAGSGVGPRGGEGGACKRSVAVTNAKGGVGKSTTAINLGAALEEIGRRVLLIDADPSGNAALGLFPRGAARSRAGRRAAGGAAARGKSRWRRPTRGWT